MPLKSSLKYSTTLVEFPHFFGHSRLPARVNFDGESLFFAIILRAYEPLDPGEFDALIDAGIQSGHIPLTDSVWAGIRQRDRKLARKQRKGWI
jgi:hypothetical protein